MIKPGGTIVYCTCSLQIEEGPAQISAFLSHQDNWIRDPIRGDEVFGFNDWLTEEGALRTLPHDLDEHGGMDGFFAARLKQAS
jgi:16S rRNA (cytosine967-C5)-methyltransferase